MTRKVTATEAKARILALLDDVADGEEVEITRHGRIVARLVPAHSPHGLRGRYTGVAMTSVDDKALYSTGESWELEN